MKMAMAPDSMRCNQQGKSNLFATLMATREVLSRNASHFVIVMMAAMADLVNPRFRDLFAGTIHLNRKT